MDTTRAAHDRGIYREASLEKLAAPDRLDALVRIVDARAWIAVVAVGLGLALALVWSVLGRIPSTARGTAILVKPKLVVAFQSAAEGKIQSIEASVGDDVAPGDLVARIRLPVLDKELEQQRLLLEQQQKRSARMTDLEAELAQQERGFIETQRSLLQGRMESVKEAAERYRKRADEYLEQQRTNLATSRARAVELAGALEERYQARKGLFEDGQMSAEQLLDMRTRVIDNELRLADLDVEDYELELRVEAAKEDYEDRMDVVQDLGIQVNDLKLRELAIDRRLLENELSSSTDEQAIRRRIEELETRLEVESRVVHSGKYPGRILEITAFPGKHVDVGDVLGKMEIEDPDADLMALAYFEVKSGKKVEVGDEIQVTPSTVERERFGGIEGRAVRRSDYPVTTAAAANEIGDVELARTLLGGQSRIEVLVALETDRQSPSGFAWTSGRGPADLPITAGTTGDARVTIEKRAPISLVLPFVRSVTGL